MSGEEYRYYDQQDITQEYSFDELAKGMASGAISRGRALKLVGVALLGFGCLGMFEGIAGAKTKQHKTTAIVISMLHPRTPTTLRPRLRVATATALTSVTTTSQGHRRDIAPVTLPMVGDLVTHVHRT